MLRCAQRENQRKLNDMWKKHPHVLKKSGLIKWKWRDVAKYGDPYSELVLCIYPSKVHTQQWTHTHCEHTPGAVGSYLCCSIREQLGVQCLAQGHLSRAAHSLPHLQFLPARGSNLQPFGYKSDSLTIRARLPKVLEIAEDRDRMVTKCWDIYGHTQVHCANYVI